MQENNKYNVVDLVNYAYDQKPLEFVQTFQSMMVDRINNAIVDKKIEVAKAMFAAPLEDSETEYSDYEAEEEETEE